MKPRVLVTRHVYPAAIPILQEHCVVDYQDTYEVMDEARSAQGPTGACGAPNLRGLRSAVRAERVSGRVANAQNFLIHHDDMRHFM